MVRYTCPKCSVRLESSNDLAGRQDECPSCGFSCTVPTPRKGPSAVLVAGCVVGCIVAGVCAWLLLGGSGDPPLPTMTDPVRDVALARDAAPPPTTKPAPPAPALPSVKPIGFLFTRRLPKSQGPARLTLDKGFEASWSYIEPKAEDQSFLLVATRVPPKRMQLSVAEYQAFLRKRSEERPGPRATTAPSRSQVWQFRPKRFRVVLKDGTEVSADLIGQWPIRNSQSIILGLGLFEGYSMSGGLIFKGDFEIALVFLLRTAQANPPLKLRMDDDPPVDVPDKRLANP